MVNSILGLAALAVPMLGGRYPFRSAPSRGTRHVERSGGVLVLP